MNESKPQQETILNDEVLKSKGFRNDHAEGSRLWMRLKTDKDRLPGREQFDYSFILADYEDNQTYKFEGASVKIKYLSELIVLYRLITGKELR